MFLAGSRQSCKTLTFVTIAAKLLFHFCTIIHYPFLLGQKIYRMKEYLLLFRNASGQNGYLVTAQDMAEDMPKWQSWIGGIAMQGKLVHTAPMEYSASLVTNETITTGPYKEVNSILVSGFLICKADNIEEVQEWSKNCPILKYPHSSVEIRPLIPFPTN
jgi:hypothetical protein